MCVELQWHQSSTHAHLLLWQQHALLLQGSCPYLLCALAGIPSTTASNVGSRNLADSKRMLHPCTLSFPQGMSHPHTDRKLPSIQSRATSWKIAQRLQPTQGQFVSEHTSRASRASGTFQQTSSHIDGQSHNTHDSKVHSTPRQKG